MSIHETTLVGMIVALATITGCGWLVDPPKSSGFEYGQILILEDANGNEYVIRHEEGSIFRVTKITAGDTAAAESGH